ncbi:MAG: B12-binding domain-containing radical SAM protein [Deltaproteobacteria bacterium]|nr:B12-binding domain-containing radical SAM protein [Deltaproteobacteria bacterium]
MSRSAILLFNPSTWRGVGDATAPWGLMALTTRLWDDYDILFLDQRFDPDWRERTAERIRQGGVLAAGTTGMTGIQLRGACAFLKLVKSLAPNVATVMGGVHASVLPLETVAHHAVDYVVVGEGEEVFPHLLECLAAGRTPGPDLPSVVAKGTGGASTVPHARVDDLESLPEPPWERFDMSRYLSGSPYGRMLSVLTSRGCPHRCAFCLHSHPALAGRWTGLSAARVHERMARLSRSLGVEHFHVQDDNFFVRTARIEEFVSLLERDSGPGFTWTVGGAHVAHLKRYDEAFFRRMRKAGCVRLLIGAESGSARILERVGKRQTTDEVLEVNRRLCAAGIRPIYSFISGVPDEEDDDLRQTVDLMFRLREEGPVDVGTIKPLVFYPGTTLYAWALRNGFVPPDTVEGWSGITWDHYMRLPYPWLTTERRRFLIRLYYSSLLWNPDYHWVSSPLFSGLARLLMPITNRRMRSLDFRLAVMPAVLEWLQHRAL